MSTFALRPLTRLDSAIIALGLMLAAAPKALGQTGFVYVSGRQFVVDGRPYFTAGTNSYNQMVQRRAGQNSVDEVFDEMAARSMTVMRTWAFNDLVESGTCLLCVPNRKLTGSEKPIDYANEYTLQALDATLAKAQQTGVRLVLAFVNNWDDYGGMNRWTVWRNGSVSHDLFYTDATIKTWFKQYIALLVNRVNTVNGQTYRDDPTIFAWELTNEARAGSGHESQLNSWMGEMSAYVKSIDPNHLVTTGIEGFYSGVNAGRNTDSWMSSNGQDFISNHQHATIDFATAHVWPLNWGWNPIGNPSYAQGRAALYLQRHLEDCDNVLGKPLLIEEFGIPRDNSGKGINGGPTTIRDAFFTACFNLCQTSAVSGGSCGGTALWILFDDGSAAWDDGNGVFLPYDTSTDVVLTDHARDMSRMRRADLDFDLDVDQSDFGLFQTCLSGPDDPITTAACNNADLNGDGHVDSADVALLRACQTGSEVESSVNCVY
jgi:mannan endo-1,4-beta-mannosidase